ncbi:uncharacterized protein LOC132698642 [Cylas formicarius]|uniref:uncharacterized protein LOC132698642 n=1 Tax=Cylas formicarius TaxID=197179 RepID=UPI002958DA45|nr:uncharacterized protein LOC132698642 [Cylas formicarius]
MGIMGLVAVLLLMVAVSGQLATAKVRYDNYKVYKLTPKDESALKALRELEQQSSDLTAFQFWSSAVKVGTPAELMIPPHMEDVIDNMFDSANVDSELVVSDVQALIDNENPISEEDDGFFEWRRYHTLDEINTWLLELASNNSEILTVLRPGKTHEGRDIIGLKLDFDSSVPKDAVFMESNIHAREWITSAVNTYILNEFVNNFENETIRALSHKYVWYFFPVMNPDGFEYSHTNDRMWRKTRTRQNIFCWGVDPNRNWDYLWMTGGASQNPCSQTYAGSRPFSEPSVEVMSKFIESIADTLVAYLDFHSFSQMLLLPYGHTTEPLDNYQKMKEIGEKAMEALSARYGTEYVVGNIAETIYVATGSSMDWVKGTFNTTIAYTYELRDKGSAGFILPADQIIPSGEETLDSIITIFEEYEKRKTTPSNLTSLAFEHYEREMKLVFAVLAAVALSQAAAELMRFDNHTVYRLIPRNEKAVEALKKIEESPASSYNFWTMLHGVNTTVDLMVDPRKMDEFQELLDLGIDHEIVVPDAQKLFDNEGFRPSTMAGQFTWTQYHTLDEIYDWLRNIALNYDDKVTLVHGGTTFQGRPILGVKLSYPSNIRKKAVIIEANIHAREWITSATATFILNQFIVSDDPRVRAVAEAYDWYFFPVTNPDGLVHTHTSNRMWRKTRTPYSFLCVGADPNRNWPYQWMQNGGASSQPCSDLYAGPNPLSESSTNSFSDFITSVSNDLEAYISLHSFSQMLLIPYGHTTQPLDNYWELREIGLRAVSDLAARYGTRYVVGNVAETIYIATGSSVDWVKHTFGVPLTYTYELRDEGQFGFALPASQIIPTGLETLDSFVSIFNQWRARHPV